MKVMETKNADGSIMDLVDKRESMDLLSLKVCRVGLLDCFDEKHKGKIL